MGSTKLYSFYTLYLIQVACQHCSYLVTRCPLSDQLRNVMGHQIALELCKDIEFMEPPIVELLLKPLKPGLVI